jgi:hypothetical protein
MSRISWLVSHRAGAFAFISRSISA